MPEPEPGPTVGKQPGVPVMPRLPGDEAHTSPLFRVTRAALPAARLRTSG